MGGNSLLAAVDPDDAAEFEKRLELVDLREGEVLYEDEARIDYAYFPHDAVLAIFSVLSNGQTVEMTTIGREGMFGFVAALGSGQSPGRCVVQSGGKASRIDYANFKRLVEVSASTRQLFLCYVEALLARTLRIVACNAAHGIEERCCRSLLMLHDRLRRDRLPVQHEFLAQTLGVYRPSISRIVKSLQSRGVVSQHRGSITIEDREALEASSCECYWSIRAQFQRLLPKTYE